MNNKIVKLSLIITLLLLSCGDEHQFFPELSTASSTNPKIKFVHAASDTVGVNLLLDGVKITGALPNTVTTFGSVNLGKVNIGTIVFQNAYPVTDYSTVENSSGAFSVVVPEAYNATTTFSAKTISTLSAPPLESTSYYTVALLGITPSYTTVIYKDDLSTVPIDGNTYIRFANFIHNSTGNLTLKATPPATAADPNPTAITLFPNVAYKDMTGFIALPRTGAYTNVQIFNATTNTTTVIATAIAANSSFVNNKVYTIFARGRIGGTATGAPGISRMVNR